MSIEKSDFIEFPLQEFIKRLDDSVESLSYEYDDGTAEEYCVIQTIFYKGIMPSETGFRFSSGL